jgi:hypothetical protein
MPTDPRKRQKKLERRAAKRKSKHQQLARQKQTGLAEQLTAAAACPVLHSWATEDFWTQGIGWVCLSRVLPNGLVAFGLFLVDRYCLGVKNAMADVIGRFEYEDRIARKMRSDFGMRELDPPSTLKLVESAVAYAESLGFHPHPDYHKARRIFGSIDPAESTETFEFGKDGKPFFIAGPNDTPQRCRLIMRTLEQHCGPGGYQFMVPMTRSTEGMFELDEEGVQELEFSEEDDQGEQPV